MENSNSGSRPDELTLASRIESWVDRFSFNWGLGQKLAFGVLLLALVIHFLLYLFSAYKNLPFPYEFKGWAGDNMMYTSWLLSKGQNFYVDPSKEVSAAYCYTPFFQFLNAPLVRIFGPQMWVGRTVAIAGLCVIWVLVFIITTRLTGARLYGLIAVGFLMATYGAMESHYDDIHPDSWCAALGLLSLVFSEASLKKRFWLFPAAFAAFLSYFCKQPGVSFAMGAAVFLFINRPRYAFLFIGMLSALLIIGYVVAQALTEGMFWTYTVAAAGELPILWYMIPAIAYRLSSIFIFGFMVLFYLIADRPRALPLTTPYALALPFVFILYGITSARYGGALMSNFFPAMILGSILLATALKYLRTKISDSEPKTAFLLLALLMLQNLALFQRLPVWPTKEHYQTASNIQKYIRETPGEVLVFYRIAFAYLNGKEVYDNWNEIFEHVHRVDYGRLESQIEQQRFSRIIIPQKSIDMTVRHLLVMKILENKYELETTICCPSWYQTTPMLIYRPKPK